MEAPSGTVTFLFTDIEGSTLAWEAQPEAMRDVVARHDEILREAVGANCGLLVKTTGDGLFAAFSTAQDGVAAALDGQIALAAEGWGTAGPVRVRMGLHTGDARFADGDYHGPTVNRAARLTSAAHGGQILVSGATAALVRERMPPAAELFGLGEHRLRDLGRPEVLYQLVHPELPRAFPPLRTLESYPGNLPLQVSSFIGRTRELPAVAAALDEARVVTLTGVGGVGKTRLALQVAALVLPRFREGAWLVELAPVRDPDAVMGAVAAVFGVGERSGMDLRASLADFLGTKQLLLLLDNCEHLLDEVAGMVEDLQRSCAGLRVLATSREGLAVEGERVLPVPSLRGPGPDAGPETALESDAVRLFVDRATGIDPSFRLGAGNTTPVVQLCERLDGIPLAIELAAARVGTMTLTELVVGLERRFETLAGGRRRAVQRHQTLRAAIDWSFELLTAAEARVLARLAVFAGGCTRQAAEAVCGLAPLDTAQVFGLLAALVSKSLVVAQRDEPETRYRLLETIREYGEERLAALGETEAVRSAHARYYRDAAETQDSKRYGPGQVEVFRFLSTEQENLLAALNHAVDTGDVELGLRLLRSASGISQVVTSQVRLPTDAVLRLPGAADHQLYPFGVALAAVRAAQQGDWDRVETNIPEALAAAGRLGSADDGLVEELVAVSRMTMSMGRGSWEEAAEYGLHAAELARTRVGSGLFGWRLASAAMAYMMAGDLSRAVILAEEGLEWSRRAGAPRFTAMSLVALAGALAESDPTRARQVLDEGVELLDTIGVWGPVDASQATLVAARIGDWNRALQLGPRAVRQLHWDGDRPQLAGVLNIVARGVAPGDPEAGALLLGAARRMALDASSPAGAASAARGPGPRPGSRGALSFMSELRRQARTLIEEAIGAERARELSGRGEAMDEDHAVAYAIDAALQAETSDRASLGDASRPGQS